MRGEDLAHEVVEEIRKGSPPHARGRRFRSLPMWTGRGITPACAGKTSSSTSGRPATEDHPRMRGEDFEHGRKTKLSDGSPPHARGRPFSPLLDVYAVRITPACAGKTSGTWQCCRQCGDHPRMRGEDTELENLSYTWGGSPPHARGRPGCGGRLAGTVGITPACAGKTSELIHYSATSTGSPPHARGRLRLF